MVTLSSSKPSQEQPANGQSTCPAGEWLPSCLNHVTGTPADRRPTRDTALAASPPKCWDFLARRELTQILGVNGLRHLTLSPSTQILVTNDLRDLSAIWHWLRCWLIPIGIWCRSPPPTCPRRWSRERQSAQSFGLSFEAELYSEPGR
jgi:hypothetical protein